MAESENKTSFKLEFKFKCEQCSKAYPLKHHLNKHVLMAHNKKKDVLCTYCNKAFQSKLNLLNHLPKHFGNFYIKNEKLYQCEKCDTVYIELDDFMNHAIESCYKKKSEIRKFAENSNKPYKKAYKSSNMKCDKCNGSFKTATNLNSHKKMVHEKIKNGKCDICNKSFFTQFDVRRHIATVHEKSKLYKCDYCEKSFARKREGLEKHIAKDHK